MGELTEAEARMGKHIGGWNFQVRARVCLSLHRRASLVLEVAQASSQSESSRTFEVT